MSSSLDKFCGSRFWNVNQTWYSDDPELSECLQRTVLSWIPMFFLWTFTPMDLYLTSLNRKQSISWNWLNITKLSILSLLMLCSVADLIHYAATLPKPPVFLCSPLLNFLTYSLNVILTLLHVKRGIRASGLLFIYWTIMVIADILTGKKDIDAYINGTSSFNNALHSIVCSFHFFLFLLNLVNDKTSDSDVKDQGFGSKSNLPSRLLFSWLTPLIWKGYRKLLQLGDLSSLTTDMKSNTLAEEFNSYWFEKDYDFSYLVYAYLGEASVLGPICRTVLCTFLLGAVMKFLQDLAMFASPQILRLLLALIKSDDPIWKGYLFSVLLLAAATLQTIFSAQYSNYMYSVALKIRTTLLSAIYAKGLRLSNQARKEFSTGEISTLAGVDTDRIMNCVQYLNLAWSAPLEVILVFVSLWDLFGVSTIPGIVVMICLIPANYYLSNKIKVAQECQMTHKDKRLKTLGDILAGIKAIKVHAWESCMSSLVDEFREIESKALKKTAKLIASSTVIWACTPFIIILVIFATYVTTGDGSHILDAQTAFTAISLINILRTPLSNIPLLLNSYAQAKVSVQRINKYMNADEVTERADHPKKYKAMVISIDEGTFAWTEGGQPCLREVTLRVPQGRLVAIVGAVASGKSALLLAILAQMHKVSGSVSVKGREAYVAQTPWIQNASLRENILFGKEYIPEKYVDVLEASALDQDLELLPDGDATLVGEMGSMLSGGQRARVALARAIYQDADIYYLDDPLGSLDSKVSAHVFRAVIGPQGLLKNKTRLLVTGCLEQLAEADDVVVLRDGQLAEIGPFEVLASAKGGELAHLVNTGTVTDTPEEFEDIDDETDAEVDVCLSVPDRERYYSFSAESFHSCTGSQPDWKDGTGKKGKRRVSNPIMDPEELEVGQISWAVYGRYLRSVGLVAASASVCWNIMYEASSVASGVWLAYWTSDIRLRPPRPDIGVLDRYLAFYFLIGILIGITAALADGTPMIACWRAGIAAHKRLLATLLATPVAFFYSTPAGRILTRFATDIDVIDNSLPRAYCHALWCSLELIGMIAIISYTTPLFVTLLIPVGLCYFFLQQFYVRTSRQLKRFEASSRAPMMSSFNETRAGSITIRAFGASETFIRKFHSKLDTNNICLYPSMIISRWLSVRLEVIGNCVIFFSALFAVFERKNIEPALVGLSISYALQITQALNGLVRGFVDVETYMVSVERTEQYSNIPKEKNDFGAPRPGWPEEGRIEFKEFTMSYQTTNQAALRQLTAVVQPRERVGIVGRTGAGKSSLASSLFRLVEGSAGSILIDGVNIANLCPRHLRTRLAILPQEPTLFTGSVKMNLDPEMRHTDIEIWSALEKVQLKTMFSNYSEGLNYCLEDAGNCLSIGEKQLLCLARLLLNKKKVLIIDEGTAHLDIETDEKIQKLIREEFAQSTVLTIAHRIHTVMDSDKIIVLDKGIMMEFDTVSNLIENKDSLFFEMTMDSIR